MKPLSKVQVRNSLIYGYTDSLLSFNDWKELIKASINEIKYGRKELEDLICKYIVKNTKKPLAVMFSGGVDSTFMLCMARKCFSDEDIKVVTCGFNEVGYDESGKVNALLKAIKFDQPIFNVAVNSNHINNVINRINEDNYTDLFFSSSLIPCYMGMQKAFRIANSILTGDGGDELFGGYDRYVWMRFASKHPLIAKSIAKVMGGDKNPRSRKFRDFDDYKKQNTIWSEEEADLIYHVGLESSLMNDLALTNSRWQHLVNTLNIDTELFYEDMMLYDMGTELFGVESYKPITAYKMARIEPSQNLVSPFMDHEIQKYCVALPVDVKIKGMKRKIALRNSINKIIPDYDKIAGKGKKGFGVPISKWINSKMMEDICTSDLFTSAIKGYFLDNSYGTKNHGERLWACYMLTKLVEKGLLEIV